MAADPIRILWQRTQPGWTVLTGYIEMVGDHQGLVPAGQVSADLTAKFSGTYFAYEIKGGNGSRRESFNRIHS